MKNLAIVLLSVWLIVTGLMSLVSVSFPSSDIIMALLAIVTGIVFLLDLRGRRLSANLGMLLLGIWLIATGLLPLLAVNVPYGGVILAVLAVVTGILLLLRR